MTQPREPLDDGFRPDFSPPSGPGPDAYPAGYPQQGYPQGYQQGYPNPAGYPQQGSPQQGHPQGYPGPAMSSCYRHPGRPTAIGCQRCGRPICGECMVSAPVGFQCPECVKTGLAETRQSQVTRRRPSQTVTVSLLGINVAMFVATYLTGRFTSPLFGWLALTPTGLCERGGSLYTGGTVASCESFGGQWLPGVADGAVWQLLTSAFMHLDIAHIGFNMLALWVLGPQLETFLGRGRYLGLYLVSALAGAASVMWLSSPTTTTVGASGALFGLMGALLIVVWRLRGDVRTIVFWIGANLAFTFVFGAQISWQGHVGGLIGGMIAAAILVGPGRTKPKLAWGSLAGLAVLFLVLSLVRIPML